MLCRIKFALVLPLFALFVPATTVRADDQPFLLKGKLVITGQEQDPEGTKFTFTITGRSDPLGPYQGAGYFVVTLDGTIITNGSMTLTDNAGDSLIMIFKSLIFPDGSLLGAFTITGGTGQYKEASGGGDLFGF